MEIKNITLKNIDNFLLTILGHSCEPESGNKEDFPLRAPNLLSGITFNLQRIEASL